MVREPPLRSLFLITSPTKATARKTVGWYSSQLVEADTRAHGSSVSRKIRQPATHAKVENAGLAPQLQADTRTQTRLPPHASHSRRGSTYCLSPDVDVTARGDLACEALLTWLAVCGLQDTLASSLCVMVTVRAVRLQNTNCINAIKHTVFPSSSTKSFGVVRRLVGRRR